MLIVFGFICPGFKMSASVISLFLYLSISIFFPLFGQAPCSADADRICRDWRCNRGLQLASSQGRCSSTVCILPTKPQHARRCDFCFHSNITKVNWVMFLELTAWENTGNICHFKKKSVKFWKQRDSCFKWNKSLYLTE